MHARWGILAKAHRDLLRRLRCAPYHYMFVCVGMWYVLEGNETQAFKSRMLNLILYSLEMSFQLICELGLFRVVYTIGQMLGWFCILHQINEIIGFASN